MWQTKETCFSTTDILVRRIDIRQLTLVTCVGGGGRERSGGSRRVEQGELSAGMRGEFLEDEMAQLRTLRHSAGIKRLRGREHSRYGNNLCKGLEVREGDMCKDLKVWYGWSTWGEMGMESGGGGVQQGPALW